MATVMGDIDTARGLVERDFALGLGELVGAGAFPDRGGRLELIWALLWFGMGWIFLWASWIRSSALGLLRRPAKGE